MQLPFTLPDWAPPWASFVIASVAVLFILAFLLMPFSVLGVKGRIDGVEARLDDIQNDLRALATRLPDMRRVEYDAEADVLPPPRSTWQDTPRTAAPPRPVPADSPPPPPNRRVAPNRAVRSEPRLGPD